MTERSSLSLLLIFMPLTWIAFYLYGQFIPPNTGTLFFFLLLFAVSLTCTMTPLAYWLERRLLLRLNYRVRLMQVFRQSCLLSCVAALNLFLLKVGGWNWLVGLAVLGAAIVLEVLLLSRR